MKKNSDLNLNKTNTKYLCYIIIGSDFYHIKEYIKKLFLILHKQQYKEHITIIIDANPNWTQIFTKFCCLNLFFTKKIINIIFLNKSDVTKHIKYIQKLLLFLHDKIILIIEIHNIMKCDIYKKYMINNLNIISLCIKFILCVTLNYTQFKKWLISRCKTLTLNINHDAIDLMYTFYNKNLSLLNQILLNINLSQKKLVTVKQLTFYTNTFILIKYDNLLDTILTKQVYKSLCIIHKIKLYKYNPIFIIKNLSHDIVCLMLIKKNIMNNNLFNNLYISQHKYNTFIQLLPTITIEKIYLCIKLLSVMEINIKNNNINLYCERSFWIDLEKLVFLFI
ncbi:hypothetical protein [Enterobacteriaceae endosymbiont of Macroplea appendiculata]|uniref:hypothetical protein n=1 Tax=Enterobacteriaceae endosymbiont of Macroplea appendiculata TaxID=2675790 RepID=UPI001B3A9F4D|nr:hypothetical protein [Enterobacteriaceae endosymbiont of Macroplea appendiculata]